VKEQTFRFNERKANDGSRFQKVLSSVSGKRLTYKELTNYGRPPSTHESVSQNVEEDGQENYSKFSKLVSKLLRVSRAELAVAEQGVDDANKSKNKDQQNKPT
jgi:hypothetical protein